MNLYRPLEPKAKWDRFFPKSGCKPVDLGKGETGYGIQKMAEWARKYAWQTKNLAHALKGKTLVETLKNVHSFVYGNFQYAHDNHVQHLESPACAWAKREKGMNCKGYSIMASSILQNLGIEHAFRRVRYPGNNDYTHVFIVVPVNGKEYIIDGTLPKFNYTPIYKQYKDKKMKLPYVGLQSPSPNTKTKRDILRELRASGYTPDVLQFVSETLKDASQVKKDESGYYIDGIYFPFSKTGLNDPPNSTSGWVSVGEFQQGNVKNLPQGQGQGQGQGQSITWDDVKKIWQDIKDFFSWLGDVVDWVSNLISGCNNAIWPPDEAKEDVKENMEKWQRLFKERVIDNLNQGNIQLALQKFNGIIDMISHYRIVTIRKAEAGNFHKCTTKSALEIFKPAIDKAIDTFKKAGEKVFEKVGYKLVQDGFGTHVEEGYEHKYPKFKLVKLDDTNNTGNNETGVSTTISGNTKKSKSAIPLLAGLGVAILLKG